MPVPADCGTNKICLFSYFLPFSPPHLQNQPNDRCLLCCWNQTAPRISSASSLGTTDSSWMPTAPYLPGERKNSPCTVSQLKKVLKSSVFRARMGGSGGMSQLPWLGLAHTILGALAAFVVPRFCHRCGLVAVRGSGPAPPRGPAALLDSELSPPGQGLAAPCPPPGWADGFL